jgi:hypothetical protein
LTPNSYKSFSGNSTTGYGGLHRIQHRIRETNSVKHSFSTKDIVSFNPKEDREKMISLMFDKFNVPSFFLTIQGVLSLYSSGRNAMLFHVPTTSFVQTM